jgi:membrane protein DedA with SNARE-associated domain
MTLPAWLQALIDWVALHPESAGVAIFIISAVESLALIGILIPGVLILFAFGTLVGAGVLPVVPVLLWAFAGAVLGDQISFWLGWNLKERLWGIWPLSRYPQFVGKSERFFNKYGAASVFIGRFIGPIRPVIPAMAGMSNMPPLKFTLVNLSSAALWSPAYLLPGAVLGASMQVAGAVAAKMALLMILIGGLSYLWVWASGRFLIRVPTAVQGTSITLFTTALIGVVLWMVLRSSSAQLACDGYETQSQTADGFLSASISRQGGIVASDDMPLRYIGPLEDLLEQAGEAGLDILEPAKPADYLRWLLPEPSLAELTPRVRLHCYHRPAVIVRWSDDNAPQQGWQLRLWPQNGNPQYWLGQLETLSVGNYWGLISWPATTAVSPATVDWPSGFAPEPIEENWQWISAAP